VTDRIEADINNLQEEIKEKKQEAEFPMDPDYVKGESKDTKNILQISK
jgi:hypothetical protein